MIYAENDSIFKIAVHMVGNHLLDEDLKLSKNQLYINHNISSLLVRYFIAPFKGIEFYNLHHSSNLDLNEVFVYTSKIFTNPDCLFDESVNLAKHLYEQSKHPKIKGGEFYVVYFKNCTVENRLVDAIGLFKTENKDTFLKIVSSTDGISIESESGVNINKLDKGCLIFNTEKENGYLVSIVDNTNKSLEAQYWKDEFLQLSPCRDEFHNTKNILNVYRNYVTKILPTQFEVSKIDQANLLNASVAYLKDNKTFDLLDFTQSVINKPDVIKSFNTYRNEFQKEKEIDIDECFTISDSALKKQARAFKSVIKLDTNFDIYVHGNRELIEQGEDKKGKFYKVYYKEES